MCSKRLLSLEIKEPIAECGSCSHGCRKPLGSPAEPAPALLLTTVLAVSAVCSH